MYSNRTMRSLTTLPIWKTLQAHQCHVAQLSLQTLFAADPSREHTFSVSAAGWTLDYSKNRMTEETRALLCALAAARDIQTQIQALIEGLPVNYTENRAALHTALRCPAQNRMPEIQTVLTQMKTIVNQIRSKQWTGYSKKSITDIVNIGIGGSDMGPLMVTEALKPYHAHQIHCHFVSNMDAAHISEILRTLNPETTLFIVSSKSFTTPETCTNAQTAKQWLLDAGAHSTDIVQHFLAVTNQPEKALAFGISPEHILELWEWVGGRYSVWSAIGLPIAIAVGMENFENFLAGAHDMDKHFQTAPFEANMPVLMALLGIWYTNFWGAQTLAVIPYDHSLRSFPPYLQQLDMESNGKQTCKDGSIADYMTGPIIWGAVGSNSQHSFHQLLHQGSHLIPADFIMPIKTHYPVGNHHHYLLTNCRSQTQALMQGKTIEEALAELRRTGISEEEALRLAPHKVIPGNRPTNTLFCDQLTPYTLGALIALYEHKVFVQGVIWNINSFDQWGIELGKQLANMSINV